MLEGVEAGSPRAATIRPASPERERSSKPGRFRREPVMIRSAKICVDGLAAESRAPADDRLSSDRRKSKTSRMPRSLAPATKSTRCGWAGPSAGRNPSGASRPIIVNTASLSTRALAALLVLECETRSGSIRTTSLASASVDGTAALTRLCGILRGGGRFCRTAAAPPPRSRRDHASAP